MLTALFQNRGLEERRAKMPKLFNENSAQNYLLVKSDEDEIIFSCLSHFDEEEWDDFSVSVPMRKFMEVLPNLFSKGICQVNGLKIVILDRQKKKAKVVFENKDQTLEWHIDRFDDFISMLSNLLRQKVV